MIDHDYTDSNVDVITDRINGLNFIVTAAMGLEPGLVLTVAFIIHDKTHPAAKDLVLDGVLGGVLVENFKSHDLGLSKQTTVFFVLGELPPFGVGSVSKYNEDDVSTTIDYADYTPINFLFYLLNGDSNNPMSVIVGGKRYPLDLMWRKHLKATCKEALEQRKRLLGPLRIK